MRTQGSRGDNVTADNSLINAHTVLMLMCCNRHNTDNRHFVLSINNLGDNISVNTVRLANNPTLHNTPVINVVSDTSVVYTSSSSTTYLAKPYTHTHNI